MPNTLFSSSLLAFKEARKVIGPVLLHILTQKVRGYVPAERHPARFHGAEPFDIATGLPLHKRTKANYTDVFATVMRKMGERQENLVAITAAMPDGTGLKRFKNVFPERFFDVGIAEQHAVTFAAGLAAGGMIPVVAVYSSFLQRAFDQIVHDVCIQNLHVIFAQSISTTTFSLLRVAAARITTRIAFAMRPCLPITLPMSSSAT